jgi:hypothetical protein
MSSSSDSASVIRTLGVSALLFLTVGCSTYPQPSPTGYEAVYEQELGLLIEEAIDSGASETQIAILRHAQDSREVRFDDLDAAIKDTFSCFEDAGIEYAQSVQGGLFPLITYSFVSLDGNSAVADRCILQNSQYVEMAYAAQPAARDTVDAALEEHREGIIACLQGRGIDIADDASTGEIREAARVTPEILEESMRTGMPLPDECILRLGILSF